MARNGAGTYSLPSGNPVVTGTVISSTTFNNTMTDVATALTGSVAADGQTPMTGPLAMGANKITGVGNASARTDVPASGQVQDGSFIYVGTVGGTGDAITLSPSPAITSYSAGQTFRFVAGAANTTNVTVQVSGLSGPKAITKNGTTALVAGDIPSGALIEIRYDGTQFQLDSVKVDLRTASSTFSGTDTFTGPVTFTALPTVRKTGSATYLDIDAGTAGQQALLEFQDGGVTKWQLGKQTTNGFIIYDAVGGATLLTGTTSGGVQIASPTGGDKGQGTINGLIYDSGYRVGLVKLNSGSVTSAATLDIVMTSYTAYRNKLLVLDSFLPVSGGVELWLRVSTNGGSSYDSGATDYDVTYIVSNSNAVGATSGLDQEAQIAIARGVTVGTEGIGEGANEGVSGEIKMFHTTSTGLWPRFLADTLHITQDNAEYVAQTRCAGHRRAAQDTDAIQILFSSGDIASGNWALFGYV